MVGPYLLVRENPPVATHVHLKAVSESDTAAIVNNEHTHDLQDPENRVSNTYTSHSVYEYSD